MGLYNVVAPCVVGKLHHVRPTTAPIEVDDALAGPLVEAGKLEPFGKAFVSEHPLSWPADAQPTAPGPYADPSAFEPAVEQIGIPDKLPTDGDPKPSPRQRNRRRPAED